MTAHKRLLAAEQDRQKDIARLRSDWEAEIGRLSQILNAKNAPAESTVMALAAALEAVNALSDNMPETGLIAETPPSSPRPRGISRRRMRI
jgi:hypothetical protein